MWPAADALPNGGWTHSHWCSRIGHTAHAKRSENPDLNTIIEMLYQARFMRVAYSVPGRFDSFEL